MADNISRGVDTSRIKEAVCVDTKRIYDSCISKDCLEDLRVSFSYSNQALIDNAASVKCKECKIINTRILMEEVPFNRGFYSVDVTYFFRLKFDTYAHPCAPACTAIGYAAFSKTAILYGSEGNVKIFSSERNEDCYGSDNAPARNNPVAKVQVVDPVVLSTQVVELCNCCIPCCCCLPDGLFSDGDAFSPTGEKAVLVTLGMFSIIQVERDVQMLVPAYDFCIPEHECCCDSENPCDIFRKIQFPIDEFFPRKRDDNCCCD